MDAWDVQASRYEEAAQTVERIADLVGPNDKVLANLLYTSAIGLRVLARDFCKKVRS